MKFNDERVEQASKDRALRYNYGGESDTVDFSVKEMKVKPKKHQNKTTAYMLVYVSKPLFGKLFKKNDAFPSWLQEATNERKEMEEERKMRKQSVCDLPILKWNDHFLAKAAGTGLLSKEMVEDADEKVDIISKSAKVSEWLKELKRTEDT